MFITKSFELLRSAELTVVLECWLRWGFGYEGFDPASIFPLSQDKDEWRSTDQRTWGRGGQMKNMLNFESKRYN